MPYLIDKSALARMPHPRVQARIVPILEDGEAHSGRRPKYELFGDELRLTLWAKRDLC